MSEPNRFCHHLRTRARGVDCGAPISELGDKLGTDPTPGQRNFVAALQEAA